MSQRYFVPDLIGHPSVALTDDEAHHAAGVMRVKPGATLTLFDGQNNEAQATVESVSRKRVECRIDEIGEVDRESPRMLLIAVALPKGDRARSVIEKAVELGAHGFVPIVCRRSVARPSDGQRKRLERYVIDASKQCGRNRLMQIAPAIAWSEFVTADTSALFDGTTIDPLADVQRIVADPTGVSADPSGQHPVLFAVGPEGGFDPEEIESALEAGWSTISLGPRILRVETAVGALLAIAQ
ncbi:Ribosomal RNA small subunit methyltransferase E [Rosistilla carotiformis]|uniref:Ribosomal RNA small subunit methyltransferase E n=1 Tax=Rosistilla carotiformis TaxID=2528017 RepID=A0A518K195_9BACT|nr:RsmE family RNA methyltransferase [Rosistilla carotiformis]QDV71574.1 Ribosomal RNA small subunit methyltransferase E [Rosistilla carotiformis]